MESVRVRLFGGQEAREAYDYFTQPHPRLRVIPHKSIGVALLRLPDDFDQYLAAPARKKLRGHRNRALRDGYRFTEFAPMERLGEIMMINRSAETRQGKPMRADYLDMAALAEYFRPVPDVYGVLDRDGLLRAYACTHMYGEVFTLSRLLGHADHLRSGMMDLLISEVIRSMAGRRQADGYPLWAMYDTYFGSGAGLREYKKRLGFQPYRVRWVWEGSDRGDH